VAALARSARCSDCPAKAVARWQDGEWHVTLHHAPDCPARRGITGWATLHADAGRAVAAAAESTGRALVYERDGDDAGFVRDGGLVTGGAA
jgi:hypothetical protein